MKLKKWEITALRRGLAAGEENDDVETVFEKLKQDGDLPDQQAEGLLNVCLGNFQKLRWVSVQAP